MNPINRRVFGSAMMIGLSLGVMDGDEPGGSVPRKATQQKRADGDNMTKKGDEFKPGDTAPTSGIYDVIHDTLDGDDHCPPHQVTAVYGETFPPCRLCRGSVRFRLYRAAEHVKAHHLLKT